jgi:MFS family permease
MAPMPAAPWLLALLLTTFIQMAGSFMSQAMPVVAPLLTGAMGVPAERIGVLTALVSFGSVVFLALGTPLVLRLGPAVALQASVICGAAALLTVMLGVWPAALTGAWLLGLAYGPVPPGTTRLLGATAPARHRGLIFSIKQAGAQAGGVLAGLILAPLAARHGWEAALLTAAGTGLIAGALSTPFRARLNIGRDPSRALFGRANLLAPFAAIAADRQLVALTVLTTAFAVAQGCLFSFCVTFLTVNHAAGLVAAGAAYACMQAGAMVGRVVLGFAADRSGAAIRNLFGQALGCAGLILVWAHVSLPVGALWVSALAFLVGALAASWNGLVLAEIARLAPPERVADAAAGSTMISFCGYVFGPALFSLAVRGFGEWQTPYALVAAQLAAVALVLPAWLYRRRGASKTPAADTYGADKSRKDAGA